MIFASAIFLYGILTSVFSVASLTICTFACNLMIISFVWYLSIKFGKLHHFWFFMVIEPLLFFFLYLIFIMSMLFYVGFSQLILFLTLVIRDYVISYELLTNIFFLSWSLETTFMRVFSQHYLFLL